MPLMGTSSMRAMDRREDLSTSIWRIMVWMDRSCGFEPYPDSRVAEVEIGGATYTLVIERAQSTFGQTYVAFASHTDQFAGSVDFAPFLAYLVEHGPSAGRSLRHRRRARERGNIRDGRTVAQDLRGHGAVMWRPAFEAFETGQHPVRMRLEGTRQRRAVHAENPGCTRIRPPTPAARESHDGPPRSVNA